MPRRRKKKGSPFEEVVEELVRIMDPDALVNRGQWVEGPDGHRELDVSIEGTYEGQERKILIECKDFNPVSTGPVGIGYVDALESKTRDLGFQFSAICSNSGFTEGAIRKASRVGIGLISVMKKGDKRIRFAISEEIYTRKLHVDELKISLEGPSAISLDGVKFDEVLFNNMAVGNWVVQRVLFIIASNPIVSGSYNASHTLMEPLVFTLPSGPVTVTRLNFHLRITGGWYSQQVTLDATHGIYDWLRHRVRLAPGPGQFLIEGVDIHAGTPIEKPPERELEGINQIVPGEFTMKLILVSGLELKAPIPNIERHINTDDLDILIPDLSPESYTSVNA